MIPPPDSASSREERLQLGEKLRRQKEPVAQEVTDEFFQRHPDWLVRFGERGKKLGMEDAGFHIDFLAAAIESDSTAAFEDYARWLARMLGSRGILPQHVVENFEQIRDALGKHLSDAESSVVAVFIKRGCAALTDENQAVAVAHKPSLLAEERNVFLQTLLKGPRKAAANIPLEALRQGNALTDIYVEIFQESLYEIGRLWESNRITIAQEHMATATVQWSIAQLYPHVALATTPRGHAVITGIQGEYHQVGANLIADALEANGWNVCFLGTNMPDEGILKAIEEHHAKLLGRSLKRGGA